MKKHIFLAFLFVFLFVACVDFDVDFDFSNPCTDPTTQINIKAKDFYTDQPLANQKFELSIQELFESSETLKELSTSDTGTVSYNFTPVPKKSLHFYWIYPAPDSSSTYFALTPLFHVSPGCTNDLDIPMKKGAVLFLSLKNESSVDRGKCQLNVSSGTSYRQITIDTFPIGYSQVFQVVKLPEERVVIGMYAFQGSFDQRDTLQANKSEFETYTMIIR